MIRRLGLAAFSLAIGATLWADSNLPKAATHAEIKAYVERAAKFVAKSGPSCDAFKGKEWMAGDYYIFVDDPENRTLCHPNASLIGKNSDEITDVNGKKVGVAIRQAAARKGGGWTEYMWPRPGTDKPLPKSTFAMHVKAPDGKTYTVGAGGYEVK
jgi:hypothetical protein